MQGNLIGLDVTGAAALANQNGVSIVHEATGNTIGGIVPVGNSYAYYGNFISGNSQAGVFISDGGTIGNLIEDNWIGLDFNGSNNGNNGDGVQIANLAGGNTIGGSTTVDGAAVSLGNVISANNGNGIYLHDAYADSLLGNLIGVDVSGNGASFDAASGGHGNKGAGVLLDNGTEYDVIGGAGSLDGNVIGGNQSGIVIFGGCSNNLVQGNKIGTDATGTAPVGNFVGVEVEGSNNLIGGLAPSAGNLVSGNPGGGILFYGPLATANSVEGNRIGTEVSGLSALAKNDVGYQEEGILFFQGASHNTVGGTLAGASNTIAFNLDYGVRVLESSSDGGLSVVSPSVGNAILGNSIFANGDRVGPTAIEGDGIVLEGITSSHGGPVAFAPNNYQNAPILISAVGRTDGSVFITGAISSTPNTIYRIELFASPVPDVTGQGQGQTFLDAVSITTDSNGNGSFSDTVSFVPDGIAISATATDLTMFVNSTSEFSADISVINHFPVLTSVSPASAFEGPLALTLTGHDFAADSVVLFNGTSVPTTLVNSTELQASVPGTLVEAGSAAVAVANPGPLGGTSTALNLTITDAPLTLAPFPQGISGTPAGAPVTAVLASFTDAGGLESADHYRSTIFWGDGAISDGAVKFIDGGNDAIFGTHTYAAEGTYTVTVFVRDDGGASATLTESISVADAPVAAVTQPLVFTEGISAKRLVATFQDADPHAAAGDFTASINWGDGTVAHPDITQGTIVADGGAFDVTDRHTYTSVGAGSYPVTVTIHDQGGASVSIVENATVGLQPLTGAGRSFEVTGGKSFTAVVANFTDPDPRSDPTFYSATINWGDGSATSAGTVSGSGSPFAVTGKHTYASFQTTDIISVTITDKLGRQVVVTSRVVDPPDDSAQQHSMFVAQLYQDLLQRPADAPGLASWTSTLDQGVVTRFQVVQSFLSSREYRTLEVEHVYSQLLLRSADASGLAAFTNLLMNGGTIEQVQATITASDEYWQRRADATSNGFLAALYQDALGRGADAGGLSSLGQALAQGLTRAQAADLFFGCDERRQDLVLDAFQRFLHRSADPAGLQDFTSALRSGITDEALLAAIVGSQEYLSQLNLPGT